MPKKPYYVTLQGLKKLKEKLEKLKANRARIIERLKEAKEMGDLSENAEYQTAREAHALNETQLQQLEELLKRAVIIRRQTNVQKVCVGCKVTLKQGGVKRIFTIVGPEESDPANGFISNESPLGRSLLGKKPGEEIVLKNGLGKEIKYKVVKIE